MITMKGAAVSAKLKEQVEKRLETLTWVPKLTIIRVGENPDDISCAFAHIHFKVFLK